MWLKYPRHFFTVYVKINTNTLKTKIPKECPHTALLSSSSVSHHVSIWRNKLLKPFHLDSSQKNITNSHTDRPDSISIATCNCHGLRNSIPYIQHLISTDMDVIVLQEHWLWPFERHILQSISDQYSFTLVCDNRLNPSSNLRCGGVAILWKKCLKSPLSINSK